MAWFQARATAQATCSGERQNAGAAARATAPKRDRGCGGRGTAKGPGDRAGCVRVGVLQLPPKGPQGQRQRHTDMVPLPLPQQ